MEPNRWDDEQQREKPEKIGLKDLVAIAIAQLAILGPIILGALLVFYLVLLFVSKVWLRG